MTDKSIIANINKAFESRIRLGIMSVLIVNDWISFSELKELLNVTDGNLSSHISGLEKIQFIEIKKQFIGKRPHTSFKITTTGRTAFKEHLTALEKLLKNNN